MNAETVYEQVDIIFDERNSIFSIFPLQNIGVKKKNSCYYLLNNVEDKLKRAAEKYIWINMERRGL